MKRFTLFILLVMSWLLAIAQNGRIDLRGESKAEIQKSDFQTLRAVFSYSSLESAEFSTEKGVFSSIMLDGTYASGEIGTPELPATHELLAVPFGATPTVSVINYTVADYKLSDYGINKIMPRQPSVRKDQKPEDVKFVYDEAAYQTRGLAAAPEASIEVQGTMRGIRIGSLLINPVSYNAKDNTIRVFNNIEVEINFEGADIAETERMLVSTYSPYFDIVYKQMFNYRQIMDVYDDHPDLMAYPVHMIVITPENYISALQPWLNWKIQKGFDVQVHTTAQAGGNYNAIQSYVQNLYNTGVSQGATPTFLILVGDTGQIPGKTSGTATQKVTDLYYGSVDGDYFPDMFYSRMSAENTTQLTNIINKILQYEQYTMPDPTYLNNVTLIAGWDSYWTNYVGKPTIQYATTYYYNTEHGFTQVNSHVNQSQYSGCYNALNTGVGFVNYTAHGDNQEWTQPNFTNNNVNQLTNANKYFLAMGNCCLSGNFGYNQPCFGEAMIRGENKGAYSYIGSCPYTYWYEDYYFGVGATNTFSNTPNINNTKTGVYDAVWMDDTYNTVSSMTFLGNIAVCYSYTGGYQTSINATYYWQAYHVLGDGSIMPYRVNPTENTVSHNDTFPADATSFTVSAEAGSYVGISQDNVLLGAALVETSGSVSVPVTPVTSGQVRIVVTKPQRQPYIADIPVSGSAPTYYNVSVMVNPADAGTVTGEGGYLQGTQCTLEATANEGYQFVNWMKDNQVVSTDATYTFTVTENGYFTANFEALTYAVTATANPTEGGTVSGADTYNYGQQCTLSAVTNTGYDFINWTKGNEVVSISKTFTFIVHEAGDYVANFELKSFEITAVADPAEGATIIGTGVYRYGEQATLTVEPNLHYTFINWTENGEIIDTIPTITIEVLGSHTITANLYYFDGTVEQDAKTIAIYPNPVSDKIIIEANESISYVEIYNLIGIMVFSQEYNSDNVEIEVSSLQSGVYFIRMTTGNNTETRRFIKK